MGRRARSAPGTMLCTGIGLGVALIAWISLTAHAQPG
jgi:hypothetical protein